MLDTQQESSHGPDEVEATNAFRSAVAPGMVVLDRWKLQQRIASGAFGDLYVGEDMFGKVPVALKICRPQANRSAFRSEVAMLLALQGCPGVCSIICSELDDEYPVIVLELAGEDLSSYRRRQPFARLRLPAAAALTLEMLKAIESVHMEGILHRDIKPGNFVFSRDPRADPKCMLVDFGFARVWYDSQGSARTPRQNPGFCGTVKYASLSVHQGHEQGRRDDLWSLFYAFIQLTLGSLPWGNSGNKAYVARMKTHYMERMVTHLPDEFHRMLEHLLGLAYEDTPDYAMFRELLERLRCGGDLELRMPYQWFSEGAIRRQA